MTLTSFLLSHLTLSEIKMSLSQLEGKSSSLLHTFGASIGVFGRLTLFVAGFSPLFRDSYWRIALMTYDLVDFLVILCRYIWLEMTCEGKGQRVPLIVMVSVTKDAR